MAEQYSTVVPLSKLIEEYLRAYVEPVHAVQDLHRDRQLWLMENKAEVESLGIEVPLHLFDTPLQVQPGPISFETTTEIMFDSEGHLLTTLRDVPDDDRARVCIRLQLEFAKGSEPAHRIHDKLTSVLDLGIGGLDQPALKDQRESGESELAEDDG